MKRSLRPQPRFSKKRGRNGNAQLASHLQPLAVRKALHELPLLVRGGIDEIVKADDLPEKYAADKRSWRKAFVLWTQWYYRQVKNDAGVQNALRDKAEDFKAAAHAARDVAFSIRYIKTCYKMGNKASQLSGEQVVVPDHKREPTEKLHKKLKAAFRRPNLGGKFEDAAVHTMVVYAIMHLDPMPPLPKPKGMPDYFDLLGTKLLWIAENVLSPPPVKRSRGRRPSTATKWLVQQAHKQGISSRELIRVAKDCQFPISKVDWSDPDAAKKLRKRLDEYRRALESNK